MTTRVITRGKTSFASRDWRPGVVAGEARPLGLQPIPEHGYQDPSGFVGVTPVVSEAPPLSAGSAFRDPQDDVVYRVVGRALLPSEGWASLDFWLRRWGVGFVTVRRLIERGLLDAALEHESSQRRFRCRDERQVKALLQQWKRER